MQLVHPWPNLCVWPAWLARRKCIKLCSMQVSTGLDIYAWSMQLCRPWGPIYMHTCMQKIDLDDFPWSWWSVMSMSLCMQGLFCHTFLNTDHVSFVMGSDSGIIEQMDMRMQVQPYVPASLPIHGHVIAMMLTLYVWITPNFYSVYWCKDASVSAISDIHLSADDSHMLVVGTWGFSLYEHTRDVQIQMGKHGSQISYH